MANKIQEGMQFIDELEHDRRYGLNFSRVNITEIPDTDDMDIWFNYSHDEEMEPDEMRVEVVVNDASIIYHLHDGRLEMRDHGNVVPRVSDDDDSPDNLDRIYGHQQVRDWASHNGQTNLFYYIAKYAHMLLVLPRTTGNQPSTSTGDGNNPFNFRLGEHSTQTYMPGNSTGSGSGHTVTAYHTALSNVSPHIRKLRPGHRASPEAIAEAERHHIFLTPKQTFVRRHKRGSEMTEQGRNGRGIKNR